MQDVLAGLPHIITGPQPAHDVSRIFAAMDIHLSPFDDGISTRRGSFLAGIQHGLPTVGTFGYNTSQRLLAHNNSAFVLTDAASQDKFQAMVCSLASDSGKRETMAVEARRLFEQEYAWDRIASGLLKRLPQA